MSLPWILPTPSLLVRVECWRDSADAVPALLSCSQTLVLTPFYLPVKTQHCEGCSGENELHLTQTQTSNISSLSIEGTGLCQVKRGFYSALQAPEMFIYIGLKEMSV